MWASIRYHGCNLEIIIFCFCLKSISFAIAIIPSSSSSQLFRNFGIVSWYSWFSKSLNMAEWGDEFSFLRDINTRIDIRADNSISIRPRSATSNFQLVSPALFRKMKKMTWLWRKMSWLCPSLGYITNWKYYFKSINQNQTKGNKNKTKGFLIGWETAIHFEVGESTLWNMLQKQYHTLPLKLGLLPLKH